jgi:hypothetical protein
MSLADELLAACEDESLAAELRALLRGAPRNEKRPRTSKRKVTAIDADVSGAQVLKRGLVRRGADINDQPVAFVRRMVTGRSKRRALFPNLCMLLPQAASRQHEHGAIGKRIVPHQRLNASVRLRLLRPPRRSWLTKRSMAVQPGSASGG